MKSRFSIFINHVINSAVIVLLENSYVEWIFIDKCFFGNFADKIRSVTAKNYYIVEIGTIANIFCFFQSGTNKTFFACLLYTSDAADDLTRVDLGGRRIL